MGASAREEGPEGAAMSHEPTDILFAAYMYLDPARLDLLAVLDAGVRIEGAVCVSRDHAGDLYVEEQDHLARQDAELLQGLGLAVGLFASPRLLATPAGAAIGGGLGEFGHLGLEDKIAEQAGETIPFDGAGLIVAYPRSSADALDKALTRTVHKTVGETDGKKVDALKKALAEAQER
jgi:uncharacterized membrane protein